MNIADQLLCAIKKNNYEADATGGTLWVSDTQYKAVVPADKRWFVRSGVINRDVSSTITARVYDAADKQIGNIGETAAATGITIWPSLVATGSRLSPGAYPLILDAAEYVSIGFGTAQTAGAFASCVVLEVNV